MKPKRGKDHVTVEVPGQDSTVGMLQPLPAEKEMTVTFNNICCWVPSTFGPPSAFSSVKNAFSKSRSALPSHKKLDVAEEAAKAEMRQVLYSVTGSVKPGELLALMGPSGGGKTTLLSILGGRTPKLAKADGDVLFNKMRLNKRVKRQIGYVMQDDLLYEALTVYETLYFAAMLRLPSHMSKKDKIERVETVIQSLGLTRCRNTIIGGFFRRGVSGGERKRVSVGHELLINPSVLLLDEPTSGLDSTTARNLLQLLRGLATSGRAIVTTIHQPSSRLYQQLDTVLLLSQGHVMFYGQGGAVTEWYDQLGFPLPFGTNVADFILDIASGEVSGKERSDDEARTYLIECSEAYLADHPEGYQHGIKLDENSSGKAGQQLEGHCGEGPSSTSSSSSGGGGGDKAVGDEGEEFHAGMGRSGAQVSFVVPEESTPPGKASTSGRGKLARSNTSFAASRPGASRWGASYWVQLQVLFIRAVRVRRFETLNFQDLAQFIIVGAVCGMIWWQVGQGQTVFVARNAIGLLFFEVLFLSFRTLFSALFTFPNEFKMMVKERASGMYRLSAFYLARTASDLPIDCSVPTVFIALIYLMGGLRHGGYFFANWSAVLLSSLVAQSFGLLIGATVMVTKTAQTIAAVMMLTFMLVGGFYVQNIPGWIAWLKWLSYVTYAYNLLLKIEFGGRTLYDCGGDYNPADPATDPACKVVMNNQAALGMFVDPNGPVFEVAVLFGFLIFFRVLVYIALRVKTGGK